MAIVRELVTKLSFSADTNKVKAFANGINSLKRTMTVAAGAATALAAGIFVLVKKTANYGDQLGETADKLNVGTEYLQAFGYAADLAGIKSEQFANTLKIFGQRLGKAQAGNEGLQESFAALGISVTDSNGKVKSTELVFTETLKALSEIEDVNKRSALAFEVLGRSGTTTANLLAGNFGTLLENVQAFSVKGNIIPRSEIKKIEKLQDSFDILTNTFNIFLTQVLAKYAPQIEKIVLATEKFIIANREILMSGIKEFFVDVGEAAKFVWGIIKSLKSAFDYLSDAVGGSERAVKILLALFVGSKFGVWGIAIAGVALAISELASAAKDANNPLGKFIDDLNNSGDEAVKASRKYDILYNQIKNLKEILEILPKLTNKFITDPIYQKYKTIFPDVKLTKSAQSKLNGFIKLGYSQNNSSALDQLFERSQALRFGASKTLTNNNVVSPSVTINVTNPPPDAEAWASQAGLLIQTELQKQLIYSNNQFPKYF